MAVETKTVVDESWNASEKYLSASNEERYYMYRQERNPYRFKVDDD